MPIITKKTLIAHLAEAVKIDKAGRVLFEHSDLPADGQVWIEAGYRPPGVVHYDKLDIFQVVYGIANHQSYLVAEKPYTGDPNA